MRKNNLNYIILLILVVIVSVKCDLDEHHQFTSQDLIGQWVLNNAITNRPMDYNNDGEKFNDVSDDLDCFFYTIILNKNTTFYLSISDRYLGEIKGINCNGTNFSGNWSYNLISKEITFDFNEKIPNKTYNCYLTKENTQLVIEKTLHDTEGDFTANLKLDKISHN
ncbi:MAG: hypothetical protein JKY08_08385 [Flavobacteriaceae bacterium]|nr:hypothetical protein [Flavobacteriaceae bacterium]